MRLQPALFGGYTIRAKNGQCISPIQAAADLVMRRDKAELLDAIQIFAIVTLAIITLFKPSRP